MAKALNRAVLVFVTSLAIATASARADAVEAFYKGRTITVINPFGEAGNYGTIVRLIAEFLPRHLPGQPRGLPQFMPGGGGLKQANYLYTVAPKDGSVIGLMYDNTPTAQVVQGARGVRYDARHFGVLGAINKGEFALLGVMASAGIASFAELRTKEAALGATGTASAQYIVPLVVNRLLGTRMKLVPGYKSTAELFFAMDQGELSGIFTNFNTIAEARPQWIAEKRLVWLAQLSDRRSPEFPDVPLLQELAATPGDRAIFDFLTMSRIPGKIVITPPDVPADRLAALRTAFSAMLRDPAMVAALKKAKTEVDPRGWQEAEKIVRDTIETDPAVVARANDLMQTGR